MTEQSISILGKISAALLLAGVFMFMGYAPPMADSEGQYLGEAFRIFYFHVPSAWVCFVALFVSFVLSIAYLINRKPGCDRYAAACAEVGWVLATIVITTGPIWARAAWGRYWTGEPRLMSFLILWLLYLGYIVLRGSIEDRERRARYCAVLSILGFLDVPIIFFAIKIWGQLSHPMPNIGFFRDPNIFIPLLVNIAAILVTAFYLVMKRALAEKHDDI